MWADPYGRLAGLAENAADLAAAAGLRVREVILEGSRNTPPELVREAVAVRRGDPILAFDPYAAKERLELIPWVARAHVERLLPGTIIVRVEEREPFAIWQHNGRFAVIDRAGKVVTREDVGAFGRLPLVVGAGADRAAGAMVELLQSAPAVMERTQALVRVAERRWNLRLRNGTDVLLPEGQEAVAVARLTELQAKQALLDRPLAAIDLRLPDKLVLRLPPGAAPEPAAPNPVVQRVRSGRG
jgi:cell division protein FtsQ